MSATADPNKQRGFHLLPTRVCPQCGSPMEATRLYERCRLAVRQAKAGVQFPTCRYGVKRPQSAVKLVRQAKYRRKWGGRHNRVMTGWGDGI